MPENEKSSLEKSAQILKWMPLSYLGLVLFSIIGQIAQYYPFDIDFFSYLSLEELALLPTYDIISLIALLLLVPVFALFETLIIKVIRVLQVLAQREFSFKSIREKVMQPAIKHYYFNTKRVILILWSLAIIGAYQTDIQLLDPISIAIITFFHIVIIAYTLLVGSATSSYNIKFYVLIYLLACSSYFVNGTEYVQSWMIRGNSKTAAFTYKDQPYNTGDDIVYLGKTKNYLFLYEKSQGNSMVFPMSDVVGLKFKNRPKQRRLESIE